MLFLLLVKKKVPPLFHASLFLWFLFLTGFDL